MTLCPYCGHPTFGSGARCAYHTNPEGRDDWATGNRAMCDYVHRRIVGPGRRARTRSPFEVVVHDLQTPLVT